MVSLGKVTAPKPVNLPSQKKENNQTEVLLSNKPTTSWGGVNTKNDGEENQQDERHGGHMPRVIPAQPMPAWGGAGLPEERQKTLELASREQFPTLGSQAQEDKRQEPNGQSYNQRDEFRSRGDRGQYWDQDDRRMYSDPRDHHDRGNYGNYYYNEEEGEALSPRDRRMSYGYRRRPYPRDYHYDDYSPEDYDDHGRDRHRFNYDDREYYPERYDNGDRYEQRPGRYERPPHRGGYDRRFGPRGMNGDMYSPRRGGYGGFRDDYYGYGGRGGHGRRRDDMRHGERFYDEEEEQEIDHGDASAGKAPPPPPPPRRPPPPPPPGTSDAVEEITHTQTDDEASAPKQSDENGTLAESEHAMQNVATEEAGKPAESDSAKPKKNPVKILKREPEPLNLEIDLGTQVSRPSSRAEGFTSDDKQDGFSVGHDPVPPSLQGLSLHPITFGDETGVHTGEQMGSDAVSGFENPEHPPGLFTSMEHHPQQSLMPFGTDTDGEHHTEDISLLLNGFEATFQKTDEKSRAQPLHFGDIVLPSTIDGCVEADSTGPSQTGGNQNRKESYKSRGRGRGRGFRGRGRGAHHAEKANGNPVPPPPPPPTSKKPDSCPPKQGGPKQVKPKKKKAGKDGPAPPGLAQNGTKPPAPAGEKKKMGQKKPYKKKPAAAASTGDNATEATASK